MLDELPALIAGGYEQVDEEDIVRLKWWGLYHDKPKIGTFMLRVKIPGGITSPAQLRAIGEISNVHGRGEGELSTRQNVQLHFIRARCAAGRVRPAARGGPDVGGCVRRHGAQHHGLPGRRARARRAVRPDAGPRGGGRALLRQPRLLRPAAQAQDRDHRLPRRLLGAGDQLRRPDRRDPRRRGGLRRARRRRALVGAADRARARHLGAEGRGGRRCSPRFSTSGARISATASRA